jgi:predicted S18 family serine protease
MKKIFALAIVVVALASCAKNHTCECTSTETDSTGQQVTVTEEFVIKDSKKSDAKDTCDALNVLVSAFGGGSCELK